MPDADFDLARGRAVLAETVREAGALALKMFRTDLRRWTKGVSSPVSEADIAVNDFLKERLLRTPLEDGSLYGWLSEESVDDATRLTSRLTWVVDPIDGTRAFLDHREDWSLSVALVEAGRPVIGAVYAPVADQMFTAARGEGVFLNDRPVAAASGSELKDARIAGPRQLLERLGLEKLGAVIVPRIGSIALRMAQVSDGRLAAVFSTPHSHDWDLAAADLLVHEAGGRLTTLQGDPLSYNRGSPLHEEALVAAGRERHAWLVEHLGHHDLTR